MKMDSEEIDEIIAHLMVLIFLTKSALPAVCQRKTPHQAMGKDQNNKRAKIQKNKRSLNQHSLRKSPEEYEETFQNLADRTWKQLRDECFEREKKFCDNLLRKGFESIYEKLRNWNQWNANDVTVVCIKTDFSHN
jgi:hypothetical protein